MPASFMSVIPWRDRALKSSRWATPLWRRLGTPLLGDPVLCWKYRTHVISWLGHRGIKGQLEFRLGGPSWNPTYEYSIYKEIIKMTIIKLYLYVILGIYLCVHGF